MVSGAGGGSVEQLQRHHKIIVPAQPQRSRLGGLHLQRQQIQAAIRSPQEEGQAAAAEPVAGQGRCL